MEEFDIGPLTWVKPEIDQALASVKENLVTFSSNLEDTSVLKFSETHLYQVSGALDMVGLQGCKRLCTEIELVLKQLENKALPVSAELMQGITNAMDTLKVYLDNLLDGGVDQPMSLYQSLQSLVELQGNKVDITELFFPDTSIRAPKDLPAIEMEEAAVPAFIGEQRKQFQKSLLDWLKSPSDNGLEAMRTPLEHVMQSQKQTTSKTLWWVGTAFVESLADKEVAQNPISKRLCRQVDQQLKLASEGNIKAPSSLMRDMLYCVGIGNIDSTLVAQVKARFELDELLGKNGDSQTQVANEEAVAEDMAKRVADLIKAWQHVEPQDALEVQMFTQQLEPALPVASKLKDHVTSHLFSATHALVQLMMQDAQKIDDIHIVEVATALTVLERALQHHDKLSPSLQEQIHIQTERLGQLFRGEEVTKEAPNFVSDELSADIQEALAKQVKESLAQAEKVLDGFFRAPENRSQLAEAEQPLEQIVAAFAMQELVVPTYIAQASKAYVARFKDKSNPIGNSDFELLAESLSALGLYVDEMPRAREEVLELLDDLKARLAEERLVEPHETHVFEPEQDLSAQVVGSEADIPSTITLEQPQSEMAEEPPKVEISRASDPEMLEIYTAEAEEVLANIAQNLQALRVNITDSDALTEVRRGFHTLKGSGRMVGLDRPGGVAWAVEKMLNGVIETKTALTQDQIKFVEKASASFADWIAQLQATGEVLVDDAPWLKEAEALDAGQSKPPEIKEEVLIDGTHKISRTLFNIYKNECKVNLGILQRAISELKPGLIERAHEDTIRATHTLASNSGATGFMTIHDLARAFEYWLEAFDGNWETSSVTLAQNVVATLTEMFEKVGELRFPKRATGLLAALKEATERAGEQALPAAGEELENVKKLLSGINLDSVEEISEAAPGLTEEPTVDTGSAKKVSAKKTKSATTIKAGKVKEPKAKEIKVKQPKVKAVGKAEEKVLPTVEVVQASSETTLPVSKPSVAAKSKVIEKQKAPEIDLTSVNPELLAIFLEEARDLVPSMGRDLRAWRHDPDETDYPDNLQRSLHTLKGSARMAGLTVLGDTVHGMEDRIVQALRRKVVATDFDELFVDLDSIGGMLQTLDSSETDDSPEVPVAPVGRAAERSAQFLRLRADVLDRLINEAGEVSIARSRIDRELLGFKQSSLDLTESVQRLRNYLRELEIETETQMQSRLTLLQESHETFDPLEFDRFTRLQELTRMMAESVNDVSTIQHTLLVNLDEAAAALQQQNRMNYELQHGLMAVRMVPFSLISERLQRIVRQTARELNKQAELFIEGESVNIDRSVLDKIGAPLEHLLRNAVAHGLESTEDRKKKGKSEFGQIVLKIAREKDEISLTVMDDGAGVNIEKVREKAIEKGLISADQETTEQSLMSLIFEPGFSTASDITQIAGRGVGLDAVRGDITGLGGRIDVNNQPDHGAIFSIFLPVTLSVIPVVQLRAGAQEFSVPAIMVEQLQKLKTKDLLAAYEHKQIEWSGNSYPLHYLAKLVGNVDAQAEQQSYTPVVLLRSGTYRTALHVDEVLGNQELVMKPIGAQVSRVPGIAGASVTGEGKIVLILNPVQLANREALAAGAVRVAQTVVASPVETRRLVMVVDDSLTMRKVLGRTLEREGYQVISAKDGMDALQLLQDNSPDIILSDIEMPRMDGFEFVRNVRADAVHKAVPIVMISSRTAEKHQTHARELGANAFLGKPVQDEQLLVEVERQLSKVTIQ